MACRALAVSSMGRRASRWFPELVIPPEPWVLTCVRDRQIGRKAIRQISIGTALPDGHALGEDLYRSVRLRQAGQEVNTEPGVGQLSVWSPQM